MSEETKVETTETEELTEKYVSPLKGLLVEAFGSESKFVPLAKVVGIAPQAIYSRKRKEVAENGDKYNYESIEKLLVSKSADEEGNTKTIEEIVAEAKAMIDAKAAAKEQKKAEKEAGSQKAFDAKVAEFTPGRRVSYETYRVVDGTREHYTVEAEVVKVEDHHVFLTKVADGKEVEMTIKGAVKKLNLL